MRYLIPTKFKSLRSFLVPLTLLVLFILLPSCTKDRFRIYSDKAYSQKVEARFAEKRILAAKRDAQLFGVFHRELSVNENQGLKFLYAYMPLSDLADYNIDFFLKQVQWSLAARDTFQWGKTIPEDVFRHFVLPCRVNNENLDTARIVIFNELKDRIRNMSMLDAALEVNHWCHEKVTYRGSDIRTSAPLASMKTAFGRCGEESTFTVAALRSVSIPARQVYTPRWAHSDDNHAWVEFWANGKWHYMGACEPECVPDFGWFTEPARRAMLIHTKAFGDYLGGERAENREANYALLNTLDVYAPVKEIHILVSNREGKPLENAKVEFQLYNYAEFYPISTKRTNTQGYCNFLTGLGDLLVWAYTDENFGFQKISVASTDTVWLRLDSKPFTQKELEIDMEPPIQREPLNVANDCKDENNRRLQIEDSIRGAYENTFPAETDAVRFAEGLNLDPARTWTAMLKSRGNYDEIKEFLNLIDAESQATAFDLLEVIAEKDLRDTKADILLDHLYHYLTRQPEARNPQLSIPYLLNPRVANEMLVAYRKFLADSFGEGFVGQTHQDPGRLVGWISENIRINEDENYYATPLTPIGVYNLGVADSHSRKIFTVAAFRSFGIPARLKPGTLEPEYWFDDQWTVADFGKAATVKIAEATLILRSHPENPVKPLYETHYTLAQFSNGKYRTLVYGYDGYTDPLAGPLALEEGFYLLVTGNRMPVGKVLAGMNFFEMREGETKEIVLALRKSDKPADIIGQINPVWPVKPLDNKTFDWEDVIRSGNAIIAWMDPDKEPTKHVIQDLGLLKKELDHQNCPFIFLIPENKKTAGFSEETWKNIPEQSFILSVPDLASLQELESATGKNLTGQFPVVIITDKNGGVTYLSSGYKIGIGEELIKVLLISPTN